MTPWRSLVVVAAFVAACGDSTHLAGTILVDGSEVEVELSSAVYLENRRAFVLADRGLSCTDFEEGIEGRNMFIYANIPHESILVTSGRIEVVTTFLISCGPSQWGVLSDVIIEDASDSGISGSAIFLFGTRSSPGMNSVEGSFDAKICDVQYDDSVLIPDRPGNCFPEWAQSSK